MKRTEASISLLLATLFLGSCGSSPPAKPDLPKSVSPGWSLKAFEPSGPLPDLPPSQSRECWKADYASQGSAQIWICGYAQEAGAFDAMQRARAEADTVKFQEGKFLVIAKWSGVTRADITALVRAIQKNLQAK